MKHTFLIVSITANIFLSAFSYGSFNGHFVRTVPVTEAAAKPSKDGAQLSSLYLSKK